MKRVAFDEYVSTIDNFKRQHRRPETNNFESADKIRELMNTKECLLAQTDRCVFLAIPRHEAFYQLYYLAADSDGIREGLRLIENQYDKSLPLMCTVIGKEAYVEQTVPTFLDNGYAIRRRLRRFSTLSTKAVVKGKSSASEAEFAVKEDAKEILEMIMRYFDVYSENVPELSEVIENIEKEQVVVVRRDNKIATMIYFETYGNIWFGMFEYTRPEYRKSAEYLEFGPFLARVFKEKELRFNRAFSWRDMDNTKLVKFAKLNNEVPQDMVFYTIIKSFGHDLKVVPER